MNVAISIAALNGWLYGGIVDPQARAEFPELVSSMGEGCTPYPYPDDEGIVTFGRGNALESFQAFMAVPWTVNGAPAMDQQVQAAWLTLQNASKLVKLAGPKKWPGGGHYADLTPLRASQDTIDALVEKRLDEFDSSLRAQWPGWDDAPPNAQTVLMRLAWACGTEGDGSGGGTPVNQHGWPKLYAFWIAREWGSRLPDGTITGCASECSIPALDQTEPGANQRAIDLFLSCSAISGGVS